FPFHQLCRASWSEPSAITPIFPSITQAIRSRPLLSTLQTSWPSTTPLCDQVPSYAPSGQSLLLVTPLAWFWNQVPAVPGLIVSTSGRRVGPLATAEQLI